MNWTRVGLLYRHELRSALRERTIVMNGILLPIFMYPVMLWVMFTGITFVQGLTDGQMGRVAFENEPPEVHRTLLDSMRAAERIEVVSDDDASVEAGTADAVVAFGPPTEGGATLDGNLSVRIRFDGTEARSRAARARLEGVIERYRTAWLADAGEGLGLAPAERQGFLIQSTNVSTGEELGQMVLGQMLSLFLVIMVALGCFIPSIDTTAGERERSTWETLMTVAASRLEIVTAKYLYVATLGVVAGALNVAAMVVSIGAVIRPLLGDDAESLTFQIPWLAVPVMIVAAAVLALFFAAAMMILASFARSFKDGQAMVMPVYWLIFLPLLIGDQTDTHLSALTAAIPVANIAILIRDALAGVFIWEWIALALGVMTLLVVLCLLVARQVLRFEEFLIGSFDGSFWRFAKERLRT